MLGLLKAVRHRSSNQNLNICKGFMPVEFIMCLEQYVHAPGQPAGSPLEGEMH